MTTHSQFHFMCQITAFLKRRASSIQPCGVLIQKTRGPNHKDLSCSVCTQGLCKKTRSSPFYENIWVAYPEFHDHGMQWGSLGHHHSTRPQVLVHRSPHIPEVQIVPRQQAGGEEWLTEEHRHLATRARIRIKASEGFVWRVKDKSQVPQVHESNRPFIHSLVQSTNKHARYAPAQGQKDEKATRVLPSGVQCEEGADKAGGCSCRGR